MERLIDDCIVMDYGYIITHRPARQLMEQFHRYTFTTDNIDLLAEFATGRQTEIFHPELLRGHAELYSFLGEDDVRSVLSSRGVRFGNLRRESLSLEDAFIGLTGKY